MSMRVFSLRPFAYQPFLAAAALTVTLVAPSAGDAAATWGGARSGLPWASGANGDLNALQSLRGRPLDVRTGFLPKSNWSAMIRSTPAVRRLGANGARPVVAFGMLTLSTRGQFSQCARGNFDTYMRAIGRGIASNGGANAILRLGWESNRMNGYPWAVTGDGSSWKACFRRWVSVLRSVPGERFIFDWNMGQKGTFKQHIDRMYPGNDVVDVVGVQFYDRCGSTRNSADWNEKLRKTGRNGSPQGLATWLAYAKSKGKRLSIPEWGIAGPRYICSDPGFDNPFFMQKFHEFLRQNARSIAYEAYFNGHGIPNPRGGSHMIAPANWNPRAAAAYRKLW
jgi:hypothetical protein